MAAETWLRVVIYRAQNSADEEALNYMKTSTQQVVRLLETQPGFRLGYWGHDPEAGTMAAVTYWNSREAIEAASAELEKLHEERRAFGIAVESVQNVQLFAVPAVSAWGDEDSAEVSRSRRRLRR